MKLASFLVGGYNESKEWTFLTINRVHVPDVNVLSSIRAPMEVQFVLLCRHLGRVVERGVYLNRPYRSLQRFLTLFAASRICLGENGWDPWV